MTAASCSQSETKSVPGTAVYRRRQPERTAVYQVMQVYLETWLAGYRQSDEEGLPVLQWVLSFPKRLRYFLARDAVLLNRVLRIFLNSVEKTLQLCCPDAPDDGRLEADLDQTYLNDSEETEPVPEFEIDQTVSW